MAADNRGSPPIQSRKVGFLLGAGIFLFPYLFAWFLLRGGYSARARIVSFGWMGLILLVANGPRLATHGPGLEFVAQTKDPKPDRRDSDAYAMRKIGENAIRSIMKDPDSAVFTETEGRVVDGMRVACGFVNGKNSFGAMAGKAPWLVIFETSVAMVQSHDNESKFWSLWNKNCVGPDDRSKPTKAAPDTFRGIKWDTPLLSMRELRDTVLKGCSSIVEKTDFISHPACSHMHIDNDDIDSFAQNQGVAPLFDVPVSEQMLSWSYKKFWSGDIWIHDYKDADLDKLRTALIEHYGPPTMTDDRHHLSEWDWADKKIKMTLTFDPIPKPGIGDPTPQTSIRLHVSKE